MRIRSVMAMSSALLALGVAAAPAAFAGNADYGISKLKLSNGTLWTQIRTMNVEQPDGSLYWELYDSYEKKVETGSITAYMGFNYKGISYNNGWFNQSAGTTHTEGFYGLGFNDCSSVVGWMTVQGQQTFYNAPVTICDGS